MSSEISGTGATLDYPEIAPLNDPAPTKYHGVSDTTIRRLVEAGILDNGQLVPWAPWEIRKSDLDSETVQEIVSELRATGKLRIRGDRSGSQTGLFE